MSILKKILSKDPLWISDDDHPERKDISEKEFDAALKELYIKYNWKDKTEPTKPSEFPAPKDF